MAAPFNQVDCTVTINNDEQHRGMHVVSTPGRNEVMLSKMGRDGTVQKGLLSVKRPTNTTAIMQFENGDEWVVEWVPRGYARGGCGCK